MTTFEMAISKMAPAKLSALRADYAVLVNKIGLSVDADVSGYYAHCADGIRDAETLSIYRSKLATIDAVLRTMEAA